MSDGRRSFWSSVPGLVTGLAGLLTGIVGLVTVLIQLGVVGGKDSGEKTSSSTGTTAVSVGPGGSPTTAVVGGQTTSTSERGSFTVDPTRLSLQSSDRQKGLTVKNTSTTATITLRAPEFDGPDKTAFKADATCTNVPVKPRESCTFNVLFTPTAVLKPYSATVSVRADNLEPTPVPIDVSAGL